MFEFEQIVRLDRIVAYASDDGVTKSYYIQSSTDGSSWSDVFPEKVTTASCEISSFRFEEIETRYIRFEDIDTSPDNNPSFTEVRFFGDSESLDLPTPSAACPTAEGDASPVPSISVVLWVNRVDGYNWPLGSEVTLTIDDPSNGPGTDYSDTQIADVAEWDPDSSYFRFELGDAWSIQAGQIISLTDAAVTKTLTIPNLALTAVDPEADTVFGTASANGELEVLLEDEPGEYRKARQVIADAFGNWVVDFSIPGDEDWEQNTRDVRPGDRVFVEECDEDGDCAMNAWPDQEASQFSPGTAPFREAGPLVPELTTYIPTPLDVSTEPAVVGTNLFLAALMMLPFAVAAEVFTRTLSQHELGLRRRFRALEWIGGLQARLGKGMGTRLGGRPTLVDVARLAGVMVFYGAVFSLLDRTWNPFSVKGLILFGSMTFAYGLVGIADDIVQWRVIRRWGMDAELSVRPTSVFLAVISTGTSRLLGLAPGLMFGTPEALRTNEEQFSSSQRSRLLKSSALTFTVIGLGVWLPTLATALVSRLSAPEALHNLAGGLEALLLVIFAVALENLFVQLLGLPGGFGQALKRRNRWAWLAALVGVTFLFYHTLINPRGELAEALEQANVRLFLIISTLFVLVAFGLRLYFAWQRRRGNPVVDARVESTYVGQASAEFAQAEGPAPPSIGPQATATSEPAVAKLRWPAGGARANLTRIGIGLGVLLVGSAALAVLGYLQANRAPRLQVETPVGTEPSIEVQAPPFESPPTPAPEPTRTSVPTSTPKPFAAMPPVPSVAACFYSTEAGMACMGPNGWQTFEGGEIALGANQLNAMEVCPDGRALFFTDRLYAFDGLEWHDYGRGDFYSVVDIDCSQGDEIWVAGYNGAAQYVGTGWMEFPLEQILGTQDPQEYPRALVADAQGGVWVALSNTLAHYDGSEWTLYREGQGLNKKYYFIELGLDSRLRPWALHSSGLVDLDGGIWRTLNFPISITAYDMALDPLDRVWVGTNNGLRVYENGQWRSFDVRRGDKSAEAVNLVAVDGQARVWIGTPWGVNVMDGTQWTTYYMHTSELPDNDVDMLMVLGDGPPLAAPLEKEPGQISGRVLENGVAVPGTTVEVCVEYLGMFFSGATPCADQPFKATTTTDDKGFFTLPDLPTGHYYIAVRSPNGEWKVLSTTTILGDVELPSFGGTDVLVSPGQTTTLEDIELADSD